MRQWIAILAVLALWAAMPSAQGAPVCQNRSGVWVRCEAKDAMPVGWKLPEAERALHPMAPPTDQRRAMETILLIVLFLALIAMLPEFDGRADTDWHGNDDRS